MNPADPAVSRMLRRAMVARIATLSRTGRPHVNPLYFVVIDGHVHLGTATYTLAAHNVAHTGSCRILFEDERNRADRRTLRMDGTAEVVTDPAVLKRYRRRVARKYMITPAGLWNLLVHPRQWLPLRRHVGGGGSCILDVTPEQVEFVDF